MSYIRGEYYTWTSGDGDDERIHFDFGYAQGRSMPRLIFDALVAMRWAQMSEEERTKAELLAVADYGGNIGCDALRQKHGLLGVMDDINAAVKAKTGGQS